MNDTVLDLTKGDVGDILLQRTEKYISEYDYIYILKTNDFPYKSIFQDTLRHVTRKYLFLIVGLEKEYSLEGGADIQGISYEEYHDIEKMYFLYEFSDRIHILDKNPQYGNLNNCVHSGLLSEKEAWKALLS